MKQKGENKFIKWARLLKQQQNKKLLCCLERASPIEVANFLEQQPIESILRILPMLPITRQGELFSLFKDSALQIALYEQLSKGTFAKLFSCMPSDLRVDFYQRLPSKEQTHLLPYLSRKVREDVLMLNSYSPDTAGGIMHTDFATVLNFMNIEEALAKIREDAPTQKMLYYIYVVNEHMKLVGFIPLEQLVLCTPQTKISSILDTNFVYATVNEDQEVVARKIEQYNLAVIPILNQENQIVGIVSYDDAIEIIRAEQVEDMDKFMGIDSEEDDPDYLKISSVQHLKKRVKWAVGVFMSGIVSHYFTHTKFSSQDFIPYLFYVGMIADTGGNVGSQAASVVLQALNRGQVTLSDWIKIIAKELKVSILLASILFFLVYVKIYIMPSEHRTLQMTFIIALSIVLQVICSTIIGASLPLAAKYFNGDPAVAASPAINTIVELVGLLIYYAAIMVISWLYPINQVNTS
ncbi:MAG: magnesium transporter [Candidatus Cardinium sp.]|nr:magnesium transporter [Candidatus Cardinium sp.]